MMNNETNGILRHYEWKEGNTLFCKDHLGEIFRFNRNYETLTGNSKKGLFTKVNDLNGTIYERKIKQIKIGTRDPATVIFSKNYTEKQWKSNKTKTRYEIIGYRFTPFPPKPKTTVSKIDERPFIDRFAHASYRNMLLADIKVIFSVKHEHSIELSKFLNDIQECYQANLERSEIDQFMEIVKKLIETAKTPSNDLFFRIHTDETQTFVSRN